MQDIKGKPEPQSLDAEVPSRFSVVLERFRQTHARQVQSGNKWQEIKATHKAKGEEEEDEPKVPELEPVQAEGLSAIPQPELVLAGRKRRGLDWPVEPQFVSPEKVMAFPELGLCTETCERLKELGYGSAFAVQTAVIPAVLAAQRRLNPDPLPAVLVNSFTGSGKTLAYTVPIVEVLRKRRVPRPRALILLPTKVLMAQVQQVFEKLSKGTGLRIMTLKSDRALWREAEIIKTDVPDILICAPGRLVDHLDAVPNLLDDLRFVVIDEADRLVGQSFQNWTDAVARALPSPQRPAFDQAWRRPPQRLVFSATLTRDPSKLMALQVDSVPTPPQLFVVGSQTLDGLDEFSLPDQLEERLLRVKTVSDKPLVLASELYNINGRTIVFVRSNEAAARLARLLELISDVVFGQPLNASRCSGEMRVQDRRRVLQQFSEQESGVLVCTDLIARGIDMPVACVVNYDLPLGTREYVHRVGRTARAGAEGTAWTLAISSAERKHFWVIQNGVSRSRRIDVAETVPNVDATKYEEALRRLGEEVLA